MIVLDNFKLGTIAIASLPTGGSIGTADLTVDIASSFAITQTTVGQTITIPAPTNAVAGDQVRVINTGTQSFTVAGKLIPPNTFTDLAWTGTTYAADADAATIAASTLRNQGAVIVLPTMAVGTNTVTHNLTMPAGSFSSVSLDVRDSTGSTVSIRRVPGSDTAVSIAVTSPVAVATPTTFYIVPLV